MINYHNIVFPFLHRHGCRQEADSNFRDFARTSQIKVASVKVVLFALTIKVGKQIHFK